MRSKEPSKWTMVAQNASTSGGVTVSNTRGKTSVRKVVAKNPVRAGAAVSVVVVMAELPRAAR
jgi:histone acetyltransferase (RNA polymerase elongator complex component)